MSRIGARAVDLTEETVTMDDLRVLMALLRWTERVKDVVAATLEDELDESTRELLVFVELNAGWN